MNLKEVIAVANNKGVLDNLLQNDKRPYIVTLDGPDGVGKTTAIKNLQEFMTALGFRVHSIHQPKPEFYPAIARKGDNIKQFDRCLGLYADSVSISMDINDRGCDDIVLLDRSVYTSMPAYNFPFMDKEEIETIMSLYARDGSGAYYPDLMLITTHVPFVTKEDGNPVIAGGLITNFDGLNDGYLRLAREKYYCDSISYALRGERHGNRFSEMRSPIGVSFTGLWPVDVTLLLFNTICENLYQFYDDGIPF